MSNHAQALEDSLSWRRPLVPCEVSSDFAMVHTPESWKNLLAAGMRVLPPPDEWPPCVPLPFEGELIDPKLVRMRAIEDDHARADAVWRAQIVDCGPRAAELIRSVADAGWIGTLAQGLLQPTAEQQAELDRAAALHEWFEAEGRRVMRSLRANSPWAIREVQMRAFPQLMRTRWTDGPSLFDDFDELDVAARKRPEEEGGTP